MYKGVLPACISVGSMCVCVQCSWKPEEGIESLGAVSCYVGARKRSQILCKTRQ